MSLEESWHMSMCFCGYTVSNDLLWDISSCHNHQFHMYLLVGTISHTRLYKEIIKNFTSGYSITQNSEKQK